MTEKKFSHLDDHDLPTMVDVGEKKITQRRASAMCRVNLPEEIIELLKDDEIKTKKGPVFHTAILAGIMAVKKTAELIPLCHPLPVNHCHIDIFVQDGKSVMITCEVAVESKTGVEMEALTGASVAALTIYDMCKGFSHDIIIEDLRLLSKSGGKNDFIRSA